jgi:2-oxo-4-hydroxy-4-carboxy-5-ureidoimidazoline decarboxylase
MRYSLADLNRLAPAEFVRVIGPVFEQSPWVAGAAAGQRPFSTLAQLHDALCQAVRAAPEEKKLALIRAHPDLVGRAALVHELAAGRTPAELGVSRATLAETLTAESMREQASAGLNQLSPEEIALFQRQNAAYREKFGFPFVICARLNKKEAILAGFQQRLPNSRTQEIQTALEEIFKIADLRLRDLVQL